MMNLDQLLHFTRVAEHGSFSRAAVSLDMSQPAVSRSVRQLEVELRQTLFYRHGRGIALTDEGRRLLALATHVLEQLESARDVISGNDADLNGRVVVGFPPSLGRSVTVPLVRAFSQRFPNARLTIVEALSRVLHERLLADKIDAALLYEPPAAPLLRIEPLVRQPMCLISSRGSNPNQADELEPVPLEALSRRRLLFPTAPNPIRTLIEAEATRRGYALNVVYEIDGIEALFELVREGVGDTVGTPAMVNSRQQGGCLVARPIARPIAGPALDCVVSLACANRGPGSRLHDRTIGLLREVAAAALGG